MPLPIRSIPGSARLIPTLLIPAFLGAALLAGCAGLDLRGTPPPGPATTPESAPPETAPLVAAPPPPAAARSAEEYDTTTAAQRAAAARAPQAAQARLGTTLASLGDPTDPGFWLATTLVSAPRPGLIVDPATGARAQVELRPLPGGDGDGGQISLPAMRLLGLGLTDLPELEVWVQ
ncbi:hypothetical protein [Phaeovulum vinaykumarii]|uniref:D-galactarate dehydratase n=1 Tax=Phaeovulum vinaykumarii TaxID=407234 RepID=A0A1N7JXL1_9RHOB|nr:hypothetical protein [Phaeovulum vinaykumarii]SIS53934.1 hypothetical protein SAMN05421795_101416 [Phaeovulum vinaykumarii]SOB91760.1 hypothetical protein SAMN05878426_101414 [Phaeovulum vinaykumarii]